MPSGPFDLLNRQFKVSRETFEKLSLYNDLLLKWQRSINLVSKNTIEDSWNRHFIDSIQLLPHISPGDIIDIGSGAGFPGMVLAVCGIENIHLLESDSKKTAFLKEVSRITDTKVTIHNMRIEDCNIDNVSMILSRALADTKTLLQFSTKYISHETKCLFHKGRNWSNELEDAKEFYSFGHEIIRSVTDPEGVIVKLFDISRRAHDTTKIHAN